MRQKGKNVKFHGQLNLIQYKRKGQKDNSFRDGNIESSRNEAFRIRYKGGGNVGIGTSSPSRSQTKTHLQ